MIQSRGHAWLQQLILATGSPTALNTMLFSLYLIDSKLFHLWTLFHVLIIIYSVVHLNN